MYPMYNPMAPMQQRLNQMEQQYPQFAQQNMYGQQNPAQQSQSAGFIKGRAVTSIDEAKAAMIDLDGSLHVFTDTGNKKIYTKQINLDGTATLNVFSLEEPKPVQVTPEAPSVFVERSELDTVVNSLKEELAALRLKFDCREEMSHNVYNGSNGRK